MHYTFPTIRTIDDVLPAIAGRDEFIVAERDDFTVINYMVNLVDTFPEIGHTVVKLREYFCETNDETGKLRRECRGLIFDKKGRILSRPYHKFFNAGEKPETQTNILSLAATGHTYHYLEKLDGSMIRPIYIERLDAFRWGTKMGLSDVALQAETFVAKSDIPYTEFARLCHELGMTPIFEYCSRNNRIVLDYPEEKLVLTAIRDNVTGKYSTYQGMKNVFLDFGIPIIKEIEPFEEKGTGFRSLISHIGKMENAEGTVVRFDTGHMFKVKAEWYVGIHKAKDNILHEKNVIQMLLDEKADDVKPYLMQHDLDRLNKFETDFWIGVKSSEDWINMNYAMIRSQYETKKDFALATQDLMADLRGIFFKMWDGASAREQILAKIGAHLQSQTKVDSIRYLFNTHWNETNND